MISASILDDLATAKSKFATAPNPDFKDDYIKIKNGLKKFDNQSLVDNLGIGIVKYDKTGEIVFSNIAALEMLDLTEEELYGKTAVDSSWNIIDEHELEFPANKFPANIALATQQAANNVIMGVFRPRTNDRVWLLVNAEPQFDNAVFMHVLVTFTNITAYKKVQNELYINNQLLESISNNSIDIIGIVNIDGWCLYLNNAATIISGYSQGELLNINALDLMPPKTKAYIKELLLSLPNVGNVEKVLGKIICKNDEIKYISWSFHWDEDTKLVYLNGRDKTKEVIEARAAEAKRVADEKKLRYLIFEEEEQKRNTIGYELHENVGQIIATVKMYLDSYEKKLINKF